MNTDNPPSTTVILPTLVQAMLFNKDFMKLYSWSAKGRGVRGCEGGGVVVYQNTRGENVRKIPKIFPNLYSYKIERNVLYVISKINYEQNK